MTFDTSRFRFDPRKNYLGVVMEQGRVQLDSDWNEWQSQLARRVQTGTLDTMGRAAYPATTPFAFRVEFDAAGTLVIGPGRMYVDGLLAENHGDPASATWDPALAELSNTPLPPPAAETGAIPFTTQPFLPGAALPTDGGTYLAYLDVWTRDVDYLQDPSLIEPAVSVDTTGRLQTVWQVWLAPVASGASCKTAGTPWPAASAGRLTTAPVASVPSGPCCLTDNTGYTGPENQHYRIEIHRGGPVGAASFKWSRDNGSVETGVTEIVAVTNSVLAAASQLGVLGMGRDQVLGFAPGDWIELLDDNLELAGLQGDLHRIDTIDFASKTITLDAPADATRFPLSGTKPDPDRHTRIRRWDQSGKVQMSDGSTVDLGVAGNAGDIPVPAAGISVTIEGGIQASFDLGAAGGVLNAGDYWTFAARTDGSFELLDKAPPRGIHHHRTPLAVVDFAAGTATDCRTPWSPGAEVSCGCCTVTVGDGRESVGQFTSINQALQALPTAGGEVCILPGRYYEHVLVERHDIVIRGCGYRTRLASPSLAPGFGNPQVEVGAPNAKGGFAAVVSVTASQHVHLTSFAVEADVGEVGVLIDGTGSLVVREKPQGDGDAAASERPRSFAAQRSSAVIDVVVDGLFMAASTMPAILATRVRILRIDDNRILMKNVSSLWPAVWIRGSEMHVDRNFVGIQGAATVRERLPTSVMEDLASGNQPQATSTDPVALHLGGILVAGPSQGVFLCENEIVGGCFNGVTLGSYSILDANGVDTGITVGVRTVVEDPCKRTGTLAPPGETGNTPEGSTLVAGGKLRDIVIHCNRIADMGLCGIGPIGFFDLAKTSELVSIENLKITDNAIRNTVLRATDRLTPFGANETQTTASVTSAAALRIEAIDTASSSPYAAVCLPSVENLTIHDNEIMDFGARPGVEANGIFVLHGEMIDIARNSVLETRDWHAGLLEAGHASAPLHGGIVIVAATPPQLPGIALGTFSQGMHEPGLPALRVQENVVRVALGQALVALGSGPFAISDNHFSCGGAVRGSGTALAQTVLVLNLGSAIETASPISMKGIFDQAIGPSAGNPYLLDPRAVARAFAASSNGTVLFSDNICQLEARVDRQHSITSVAIFSRDHVTFSGNHCWLDATSLDAFVDAAIVAGSVNATGNRFQESPVSVLFSGITAGVANITSQNISTFCLLVLAPPAMKVDQANLALVTIATPDACARFK